MIEFNCNNQSPEAVAAFLKQSFQELLRQGLPECQFIKIERSLETNQIRIYESTGGVHCISIIQIN